LSAYTRIWKPLWERLLVVICIPLWGALLVVVLVLMALTQRPPYFYQQLRIGFRGRDFYLHKLRTFNEAPDGTLSYTPLGPLLRRSSLDELPQLGQVLTGELALVGPRPLLASYRPYYTPEEFRRHEVRPGLTGLVQATGGNLHTWTARFKLDLSYVRRVSFGLDVRILFLTFHRLLNKRSKEPTHFTGRFDEERTKNPVKHTPNRVENR